MDAGEALGVAALRFRAMEAADLASVADLESRAFEFPWSQRAFADCLAAGHECWKAELAGQGIGHGVVAVAAGEAHLLNVCVDPALQGRGFGRALLRHLLARATARGAGVVFLEARITNRVAMTLYFAQGFREIGRRRGYYPGANGREDAVVMALKLA